MGETGFSEYGKKRNCGRPLMEGLNAVAPRMVILLCLSDNPLS
jgi:hypothetical protein